jgi:hypothetical protein
VTELPEIDGPQLRELAAVPSVEIISRAAVMLLSAAAERLGLADTEPESSPHRDLDEARRLITALAGLITASAEYLGPHAGPCSAPSARAPPSPTNPARAPARSTPAPSTDPRPDFGLPSVTALMQGGSLRVMGGGGQRGGRRRCQVVADW